MWSFLYRMADFLGGKRNISISQGRTWVRNEISLVLLRATNLCITWQSNEETILDNTQQNDFLIQTFSNT